MVPGEEVEGDVVLFAVVEEALAIRAGGEGVGGIGDSGTADREEGGIDGLEGAGGLGVEIVRTAGSESVENPDFAGLVPELPILDAGSGIRGPIPGCSAWRRA